MTDGFYKAESTFCERARYCDLPSPEKSKAKGRTFSPLPPMLANQVRVSNACHTLAALLLTDW